MHYFNVKKFIWLLLSRQSANDPILPSPAPPHPGAHAIDPPSARDLQLRRVTHHKRRSRRMVPRRGGENQDPDSRSRAEKRSKRLTQTCGGLNRRPADKGFHRSIQCTTGGKHHATKDHIRHQRVSAAHVVTTLSAAPAHALYSQPAATFSGGGGVRPRPTTRTSASSPSPASSALRPAPATRPTTASCRCWGAGRSSTR